MTCEKYLEDILQCIAELDILIAGVSLAAYQNALQIHRAAERAFIPIVEALSPIRQISSELHVRVENV